MQIKERNNDRHKEIIDILQSTTYATVDRLAAELHISASSIRRDLAALEARGLIIRSYGGATLNVRESIDIPFEVRMEANAAQKKQIAAKAIKLVNEGDTVFCEASSTTMYLIHELARKRGLTIVTNSINALCYLQSFNNKVICTGGMMDRDDHAALVGSDAVEKIASMRANIAFFSTYAINNDGTLFDYYPDQITVLRKMMECSAKNVCLCDSSKIGKVSSFKQTTLASIDVLVCDISLEEKYQNAFPNLKFL